MALLSFFASRYPHSPHPPQIERHAHKLELGVGLFESPHAELTKPRLKMKPATPTTTCSGQAQIQRLMRSARKKCSQSTLYREVECFFGLHDQHTLQGVRWQEPSRLSLSEIELALQRRRTRPKPGQARPRWKLQQAPRRTYHQPQPVRQHGLRRSEPNC